MRRPHTWRNSGALSRRQVLRLAAGAVCGAAAAEQRRIAPADEAEHDPGLAALLGKMRGLAAQRDYAGLETLMLPTFRVEFDAGKGPAAFRRRWHSESRSSELWGVLDRLFSLGGTFYSETVFAVPYVYTRFPGDLDILGHVVAVKPGARVVDQPGSAGAQVGTLDYTIVPLVHGLVPPVTITTGRYLEVKWPEAAGRCFVAEADVYSPAAHRAFFEKRQGRWRWISLACATLADPPGLRQAR
ncbi:MAG TPA: hypothetical protein VMJ75_12945 [Candidatus Acidoferrales bacterium]|nr:hypothetical protein [Candidatus Acidoferrales bacterium]